MRLLYAEMRAGRVEQADVRGMLDRALVERLLAELRYSLMRLRENGESIALIAGEEEEKNELTKSLNRVIDRWREIGGGESLDPLETDGTDHHRRGDGSHLSTDGADRPKRAIPVTIVAIEEFDDPLVATPIGSALPTRVLQIEWDSSEATTVELPFAGLTVTMNVVAAAAGEPVVEHFRIGPVEAAEAEYSAASAELQARIAGLPEAVEREAPVGGAAVVHLPRRRVRLGVAATVTPG